MIRDNTVGLTQKNILLGGACKGGVRDQHQIPLRRARPEDDEYMDKNRNDFLRRDERRGTGSCGCTAGLRRLIFTLLPFADNFVVFVLVFLLNNRTADSDYFRRIDVFTAVRGAFALFYGKRQAIVATFFSTIGFIFRQAYYRTAIEVLVDYNIYIWMAQLFIVGMAVGHLRDSIKIITDDKDEEIAFLSGQLDDIYDINSSNLKVKNILEDHIVSYDEASEHWRHWHQPGAPEPGRRCSRQLRFCRR